jgi:DNA (cytosine-5)-methyltransferase 1
MLTGTDLFCGAGGSSQGLHAAGYDILTAANHWPLAVASHNENFPRTNHDCADISQVNPRRYKKTHLLWISPECTNHSIAKASARIQNDAVPDLEGNTLPDDAAERSRATAWDAVRFAEVHRYPVVIVENVVDFAAWVLFDAWMASMRSLGYWSQVVYLNSMFAGGTPAPQSRDRIYIVFWRGIKAPDLNITPAAWCGPCDQQVAAVQTFKAGASVKARYRSQYIYCCPLCKGEVAPYVRGAAEAIDWSITGERIGDRSKPLADGTIARIKAGLEKYGSHMVVPVERNSDPNKRARPVDWPFGTQTARATNALAFVPFIASQRGGGSKTKCDPVTMPMGTVSAGGNHHQLVTPPGFVMRNNGSRGNGGEHCTPFSEPIRTLTTKGHQSIVTAEHMLVPYTRTSQARPVSEPMTTLTTHDRQGLVEMAIDVDDCSLRMLQPHEVGAGMAFDNGYIVLGNKREQVRQYGNAVTPPAAQILGERVAAALGATLQQAA